MKLIDGFGQLGNELSKLSNDSIDCTIYHKWDIVDKSEKRQIECFAEFIDYVDAHRDEKIVFISTLHENYCKYLHYKIKAELYLLEQTNTGKVIRLPYMIGKGLCTRMRNCEHVTAGLIEIASVHDIASRIIDSVAIDSRMIFLHGHWMDAILARDLVQYGALHD